MKFLKLLKKICEVVNRIVSAIVIALFIVMFIACVVQVFTRYVLNNSAVWTDETARYTFIWATMLSATCLYWEKGHAVLSFIVDNLPQKAKAAFSFFAEMIAIFIGCIFIKYAETPLKIASLQKSPALHLPMNLVYIAVPICGALFIMYAVTHIVDTIYSTYIKRKEE